MWLGGVTAGRRTNDRTVVGSTSTPGQAAVKLLGYYYCQRSQAIL